MQEYLDQIGANINVAFSGLFFTLIWTRILMMSVMIPFIFGKPVPRYVALAASLAMAFFVYPNIVPGMPPPISDDILLLVMLYLKEAFYGFCIGMSVSIIFHSFTSVGQMIDNQRGVSIARVLIPQLGEQGSIFGAFLFQFGIVIYFLIGGHLAFLDSFFMSYATLPVMDFPIVGPGLFPMIDLFIRITAEVIYIALQMSAPVIIAILLADIILGIANRIAPQINVWMLGFQLKGYIGVLLLFLSITMIGDQMSKYTMKSDGYADQVIEFLQGKVPVQVPDAPPEELGLPNFLDSAPPVKTIP